MFIHFYSSHFSTVYYTHASDYLQIQFHGESSSRTLLFILFKRFRLVRFCFCCCYCCCCFVETKEKTFSLIKMTSITRLLVQIQAINRVHNQGWWTWITRCFPALISTGIRQVTHQSTNQSTLVKTIQLTFCCNWTSRLNRSITTGVDAAVFDVTPKKKKKEKKNGYWIWWQWHNNDKRHRINLICYCLSMRLCSADRWWLLHVRQPWAKPPRRASTNSRRAANHVVAAKQQPVSFSLLVSSTGHNRHCLLIIHSTRSMKLNHFTPLRPLELGSNLNLTVIRLDDDHQVLIVFVVTGCMHNNHFWWFFLSVSVCLFFFWIQGRPQP